MTSSAPRRARRVERQDRGEEGEEAPQEVGRAREEGADEARLEEGAEDVHRRGCAKRAPKRRGRGAEPDPRARRLALTRQACAADRRMRRASRACAGHPSRGATDLRPGGSPDPLIAGQLSDAGGVDGAGCSSAWATVASALCSQTVRLLSVNSSRHERKRAEPPSALPLSFLEVLGTVRPVPPSRGSVISWFTHKPPRGRTEATATGSSSRA